MTTMKPGTATPTAASRQTMDPIATAEKLRDAFSDGAADRDLNRIFPMAECQLLRESGLLGLMVPEQYGGYGGNFADLMRVSTLLGQGDPNIGQMYQVHSGAVWLLYELATEETRNAYMTKIANGEIFLTNTYSEVGTRTVMEFNTTLTPIGADWKLNGKKFYCTGSLAGDMAFGPAMVEGTEQVRIFYIPMHADGVTIYDDWYGMGQRTTASGTVMLENVNVDGDLCFDATTMSPTSLTALIYQAVHTGVFAGIAAAALADAVTFVREKARLWYESPATKASEDPYTMLRIGEMATLVAAAEEMSMRAARLCDDANIELTPEARARASVATGQARQFCANAAMRVSEMLFQCCGTSSVQLKYAFDRHWRNARTLSVHNPLDYKLLHVGDELLNGKLPPIDAYN